MLVAVVLALVAVLSVGIIAATTRQPGAEETVPFDPVRPDPDPPPDEP